MMPCYLDANRFAKTSWNDDLESGRPVSRISTGEIFSQTPGSADVRINQPSRYTSEDGSDGSTVTAGRPSQLKNAETSLKSNDAIVRASIDIIPKDTLGTGLGYELTKEITLNVGYRYLATDDVDYNATTTNGLQKPLGMTL